MSFLAQALLLFGAGSLRQCKEDTHTHVKLMKFLVGGSRHQCHKVADKNLQQHMGCRKETKKKLSERCLDWKTTCLQSKLLSIRDIEALMAVLML